MRNSTKSPFLARHQNFSTVGLILITSAVLGALYTKHFERGVTPSDHPSNASKSHRSSAAELLKPRAGIPAHALAPTNESYGNLPISFEANEGQTASDVKFMARGNGYGLFLTSNGAVLSLDEPAGSNQNGLSADERSPAHSRAVVSMQMLDSRRPSRIRGMDKQPGKVNYFIGSDSTKWRKNIETFSKVHYAGVYPGIDVVYYGNQKELEYDFLVAPRANPRSITLLFSGAQLCTDGETGDLILRTPNGDVRQRKPVAYQQLEGQRNEVTAAYHVEQNKVTFEIGAYDQSQPLIIDPVLVYSSFMGGAGSEQGMGIAVDADGSAYLTGTTGSTDFPVSGGVQSTKGAFNDAFVVKLDPAGTAFVYGTYIGSNGDDVGSAIAVDAQGNAYIVGNTGSGSFPTTSGAFQTSKSGVLDGFAIKLNPAGSQILYSTFLGGENTDSALGVAVDSNGRAYIVGRTDSPRLNYVPFQRNGGPAYKSTNGGANWASSDAELTASAVTSFALDPGNSNIVYAGSNYGVFKSTTAGAHWNLTGTIQSSTTPGSTNALAIDPSNPNIVYAATNGGIYKTVDGGSLYAIKNSGIFVTIANAVAVDPATPTTVYAGTLSGIYKSTNGGDTWVEIKNGISGTSPRVNRIVIDPNNPATVYMGTNRGMFKTINGGSLWSAINNGLSFGTPQINALAIDPVNPSTLYVSGSFTLATSFKTTDGGANWTANATGLPLTGINNLAVDPLTTTTVYAATTGFGIFKSTNAGSTWAPSNTGFPNLTALTVVPDRNNPGTVYAGTTIGNDAFAIRLDPTGSAPEYALNFGGNDNDEARGVALDADNNAYIVGSTSSVSFPTANAFQSVVGGLSDAFVVKLDSTGNSFSYATYLGGSGSDQGRAIAVRGGSAYVTGQTNSQNFPLANAFQSTLADFETDAFVTRLSPSGSSLDSSSFLGGTGLDQGLGIAVDSSGGVYVTGSTLSSNFPVMGAPQPAFGGSSDAFVSKINPAGNALVYSTYMGGLNADQGNGIAVDSSGSAYVIGNTSSANFPTATPFQSTLKGTDAFVTKIGLGPDLVLTMSGSPNQINYGSTLTYTITVGNTGEIPAQNVRLSDTLLSGTGVISITPSQGTCSGNRFINCELETINPGSLVTITLVVLPPAITPMVNTATVSTPALEATTANNSATVNTQVDFTDLMIKNSSALQKTEIGGINTYIVTVTNKGPGVASGVTVTNNLPAETTFVACTSTGLGVCGGSGNNRTASIPSLAVNASFTSTFATRVNNGVAVGTVISDTASVNSATPDINPNNDAATAITTTKAASPPKQNGLIALTVGAGTGTDGTLDIWLANADGTGLTPITLDTPAEDLAPVWSPDGTRIAFISNVFNAPGLFVMNSDGSNVTRLSNSYYDLSPTWSPDGTRIAFAGPSNAEPFGIFVVNSDGTNLKRLASGTLPTWSPDGVSIAFNGSLGLAIMYADGTGLRNVPIPGLPFGGMNFRWSPDGTKLALTGLESGGFARSIYTVNSDGTGLLKIPNTSGGQNPAWSPDGTKLLFMGNTLAGLSSGIYTIDVAGTNLTKITGDITEVDIADWQNRPPNFVPLPPTYSIAGRVTNAVNGSMVSSTTVQASGTVARGVSTNNNGDYILRGLPAGGNFTVVPVPFGTASSNPPNRVFNNLSANQTGADFGLTFAPIPDITGVIKDQDGVPMSGVKVSIRNAFPEAEVFTDATGAFKFSNTSLRYLTVLIPFNTGAFSNYTFDPPSIYPEIPGGNNFTGRVKTASVSGQVRVGGVGKPGVNVLTGNTQFLNTTTDVNGNYTLSGVGEGITLTVRADTTNYPFSPATQTFTVNGQKTGVDFDAPANQFLIYGKVADPSSSGVQGITLTLSGGANGTTQTDAQGNFSLGPVPANTAYSITTTKPGYSFVPAVAQIPNLTSNTQLGFTAYSNSVKFYSTSASVVTGEGSGSVSLTVVRTGLLSDPVKVDYKTSDGSAKQRTDFTTMAGTLSFAPQQQSKTIVIPLNDDAYVEGDETFVVTLLNPVGGALGDTPAAIVTLQDDDTATPSLNPLDNAGFFVRQQYLDFLSRVPDSGGLTYWTEQITDCGIDQVCVRNRRVGVSNAFFYELEFQQTGGYVYRLYRAAFGNDQPYPNPDPDPARPGEEKKVVAYRAFVQDRAQVLGGSNLAQAQLNLANAFVQRPEFLTKYPANLDGPAFVDAMLATIRNDIGQDLTSQRQALIDLHISGGRGAVLYRLADDNTQTNPINNRGFIDAEYSRSFVATQYYGYLRRDPDMGGFLFWLGQVSSAPLRDVQTQHAMVCSFITSAEYQHRFSSIVTHDNSECGP